MSAKRLYLLVVLVII